jgi:hypothetical protein
MKGGRGVKKFVVCLGEEKTKEDKPYKTNRGEGGDLSIQMLQDVLCEQPLKSHAQKTSLEFSFKTLQL